MGLILLRRNATSSLADRLLTMTRLRPLRLLSNAVQHVVESKDFQPVAVPHARGEVATLTSWFNQLLRMVALMRERQTRLVLDAGHELRNPLTSLRANVDLLALDLQNGRLSIDQRTEIVGDVQAQLGELSGLVTDLVHLARDEDEVEPQPVDVCEVVDGAVDRVRRRGQDRVFDVELQPLFMMGHAESLSRAVVNLLDNAVKWTPSGGTIRVRLEGNRLRVSDEGPGIPEADLPYVFDRFFRGQTGRGTPGTGLGLSIVAKTVEDHGGKVQAGRGPSGGAEFTIQLPGVTSREALSTALQGHETNLKAAGSLAAAAVLAAAGETAAAALAARRARAAATARAASVVAETVRQQALAVQEHANAAAREVAAAAARAASRVATAVLPGQEVEARRAAALVARVTADAAAATAAETMRAAAAAARAAAAAALDAAAAAEEAADLIALEVHAAARAVQEAADETAARLLAKQHTSAVMNT
jgi:signal transduction histidine kinase